MDCVRHLDGLIAIQMLRNKKEVEKQKLHAKREAIKRVKKQSKLQQQRDRAYDRRVKSEMKTRYDNIGSKDTDTNSNGWGKRSTRSMYSEHSYSELAIGKGFSKSTENMEGIKYSDTYKERSKLFRALKGINDTLRGKKTKRNNDDDFFTNRQKAVSQPDLTQGSVASRSSNNWMQTPSLRSGSIASSNSSDDDNVSVGHIIKTYDESGNVSTEIHYDPPTKSANGTVKSNRKTSASSSRSGKSHDAISLRSAGFEEQDISTFNELAQSNEMKAVMTFLSSLNLEQFATPFIKESIDLSSLVLCSDKDLQELGLPLGPRRKILEAARRHQLAIENPPSMADTKI